MLRLDIGDFKTVVILDKLNIAGLVQEADLII